MKTKININKYITAITTYKVAVLIPPITFACMGRNYRSTEYLQTNIHLRHCPMWLKNRIYKDSIRHGTSISGRIKDILKEYYYKNPEDEN